MISEFSNHSIDHQPQTTTSRVSFTGLTISEPRINFEFDNYINPIIPYVSEDHLDIGCGFGELTSYFSMIFRTAQITGFDIDSQKISQLSNRRNLKFTDSLKGLPKFSSASGIFVFHEAGKTLFQIANQTLKPNSLFSVVDYNLKGIDIDSFSHFFSLPVEKKEIKTLGVEGAFSLHTQYNLFDCIEFSKKHRFKTVSTQIVDNKYFIWVGQN
jgi:hypothetical protein